MKQGTAYTHASRGDGTEFDGGDQPLGEGGELAAFVFYYAAACFLVLSGADRRYGDELMMLFLCLVFCRQFRN